MRPKSVAQLRRENPGKTVFTFLLAGPSRPSDRRGTVILYEGCLPVLNEDAAAELAGEIRAALAKFSTKKLPKHKPPPGMTNIEK